MARCIVLLGPNLSGFIKAYRREDGAGLNDLRREFLQNFRMALGNAKEGLCRARGFAAALLPILKRADGNTQQYSESGLRKPCR